MPIFDIEHPDGRKFEVDAPNMNAAVKAVGGFGPNPQPEAPVTAGGLYKSLDVGVGNAVAGIAGLPHTAYDLISRGVNATQNYLGLPETQNVAGNPFRSPAGFAETIQRDYRGGGPQYEPQNAYERTAQTLGEFLPNAILPGSVAGRALNVLGPTAGVTTAKEMGGDETQQLLAGLAGGAAGAKLANIGERLTTKALPSIDRNVAGNLREIGGNQYKTVENAAQGVPTTAMDRMQISNSIGNYLHNMNFRPANAPKTYEILGEIAAGPGKGRGDLADLVTARQKLGKISGTDGVAAQQARNVITNLLENEVPHTVPGAGAGALLETADKNWNALRTSEELSAKFQKAADQTGATASGLNLGNKLRQAAAQLANNPNRTKYMAKEDIQALKDLSKGTYTQNALRWAGNLIGGGGGLGALAAAGVGIGTYQGEPQWAGAAAPLLAGYGLRRGFNRSVANQAKGVAGRILEKSPAAMATGARYVPPLGTIGAAGTGAMTGGFIPSILPPPPDNLPNGLFGSLAPQ